MMLWSDSTHLANFGTAKLWPVYMALGNLSKYVRSLPNSGALHHVAYIPSLPDSFQDDLKTWHSQWNKASHRKDVTTHCRRELMHAVWRFLLDDDFVNAYKYGIVIRCLDGIERRVYPRIFTYSADYPEKVLLATIRDKGLCLCPRCLIPQSKLHLMGQALDLRRRATDVREFFWEKVRHAREWIYQFGKGIKSKYVEDHLKETSSVPTVNAFSERLGQSFNPPQVFPLSRMLVPDFMHEFELGVWKTLFTHIIRVLWAKTPDGSSVLKLNDWFRQVLPFGTDTIRRFTTDTSEMKKLAAHDFEDILQCSIPVFDGLLPDQGENWQLLRLLYRTAEFHAFAKLRCHTDDTIEHLMEVTTAFGKLVRQFKDNICAGCETVELPSEAARRVRRAHTQTAGVATSNQEIPATQGRRPKELNLSTYKFHSLGDYPAYIRMFGPSDGFSTQVGELAHRLVKRLYGLTNKRKVAMQIGKRVERLERKSTAAPANAESREGSTSTTTDTPDDRSFQFSMSESQNHPIDIFNLIKAQRGNPAYKNFLPKLQDHLLGRKLGRAFDGDNHNDFSDEDRNTLHIYGEKIYQVGTCTFYFTTYDNRRDFDVVNPTSRPDVMARSQEDNRREVPFWHARVIGIYHAKVSTTHSDVRPKDRGVERMSFLFVRWLGAEPGYRFGFDKARLPKVGFVPYTDNADNFAFGFLDPSQVLRGCHLIPDFQSERTSELLPYPCAVARQIDSNVNDDWETFYVNIFVDRDMVMRYYGGGIGHLNQGETQGGDEAGDEQAGPSEDEDEGDLEEEPMLSLPAPAVAPTPGSGDEDSDDESDDDPIMEGDDDDDGRYASD
ncbi:hypothetical protein FA13DRAFT_1797775 [Coprinellus micaceus]|uniref:Uncharacterized protein n=1 Tax=Coprinellus micaceus TaxID=71717 RepID=A0A4Y7SR47_COPMI|nr:hypothetical protein FA13DRAFT_1797775 [Coprinellus micaceus]